MKAAAALLMASVMTVTSVSASSGLYINAEFDNNQAEYGTNKYTIFGENNTAEDKTFKIMNTVSQDGKLISEAYGDDITIAAGKSFSHSGSVTVPQTVDLGNSSIGVYLWDTSGEAKPVGQQLSPSGVKFKYTLSGDAMTSAGVYDKDGKLVKTLWSGKQGYDGDNFGTWDGKDDFGNPMPQGDYEVKILSHNVNYERDSVIGNSTSTDKATQVMSGYDTISDMCLLGDRMYYAEQYMEGGLTCPYFLVSDTKRVGGYLERRNTKLNIKNATDGKNIYWMTVQVTPFTQDDGSVKKIKECFIYAVDKDTATNLYMSPTVSFAAGRVTMDIWNVRKQFNAIGIVQYGESNAAYTLGEYGYGDIAVQKNGDYLAAVYGSRDFLRIMNKTTGVTLKDNAMTSPKALAFDNNDYLWAAFKENGAYAIKRYQINGDGSVTQNLSAPASVNLGEALALDVSPDGKQLTVSYGGDVNKVVSYNISDWSIAWSFGRGGSYKDDPTVYDDKLMFEQRNGGVTIGDGAFYSHTYIEYEDNNNVWIGDVGNYRHYKLNISGSNVSIADTIYYAKQSYSMAADVNDPQRVFLGTLEYKVDYGIDGGLCWKPYKNWAYEALNITSNTSNNMNAVTTLSNGRTYFTAINKSSGVEECYELLENGFRATGISTSGYFTLKDGSFALQRMENRKVNGQVGKALLRRDVTGFTSDNNPIWGEEKVVGFVPDTSSSVTSRTETTSNGNIVTLNVSKDNGKTATDPLDMRLKSYNINGEQMWATAPSTYRNYYGDFVRDGSFEIGGGTWNTVHFSPQTFGDNIIFAYTGEGYKQGQTEIFYHFTSDGLLVGVYGMAMGSQAEEGMANEDIVNGNGFNWNLVYPPSGDGDTAYIYQGGEARLSGLVRFKVTGLNSIKTQSVKISLDTSLRNGVVAELFNGSEYLNTNVINKEAIERVNTISGSESLSSYGFRYSGYITKPSDSEKLTKLWLYTDGEAEIKINNVVRSVGSGMIGTAVELENGKTYPIEITVKNNGQRITSVSLFYEVDGEIKEFPIGNVYALPVRNESVHKTVNLVESMPSDSKFYYTSETDNNLFEDKDGWTMDGALTSTDTTVWTNRLVGNPYKEKDVYIDMELYNGESSEIRKDLGSAIDNIYEWEISTDIMLMGDLNGYYSGTIPGNSERYVDVLDENGKIIARVGANTDYAIYGNNKKIYQAAVPKTYTQITASYLHDFSTFNPLAIRCTDGILTFEYKTGSVTAPIYDSSANWRKPATLSVTANKKNLYNPYKSPFITVFGTLEYSQKVATGSYLVVFYDEDQKTVLKRESVQKGESATAPSVSKPGYNLSWSADFTNVTSNTNVYAIYTLDKTEHTVSYYDENNKLITTGKAVFGTQATAPDVQKSGYEFIGWYKADGTKADLAAISSDISLYAKYQRSGKITETFDNITIDYDNKTVSQSAFTFDVSDNMFDTNKLDKVQVMSVAEVTGKDGKTTKALYINPYRSALEETMKIGFGDILKGSAKISFDYKIDKYAQSYGFNYFGSLTNNGEESMAACVTQIKSFGGINPFEEFESAGVIRNVENVVNDSGLYTNYQDLSRGSDWHTMEYAVDMDSKTYKLTVDGTVIGTYSFYHSNIEMISNLYFRGNDYSATTNVGRYYIDNVTVEYLN